MHYKIKYITKPFSFGAHSITATFNTERDMLYHLENLVKTSDGSIKISYAKRILEENITDDVIKNVEKYLKSRFSIKS